MPETIVPSASLRERVQSLRLPDRVDSGRGGRGGWLPWALCLLLAASTASLAARVYTAPANDPVRSGTAPASQPAANSDPAPKQSVGGTAAPPSDTKSAPGGV